MADPTAPNRSGGVRDLVAAMKPAAPYEAYRWAASTEELARATGLDPVQIVRFDGNVPAQPRAFARPGTIARALGQINTYAHGGYPTLIQAIADYAGVEPANVVLGPGCDSLIMLCARAFAGPGDTVAIVDEPTYPLYRLAAGAVGAIVGTDDPAVTFQCRPNNPSGALAAISPARPLVVDEAYFEYARDTAAGLLDDGVVVLRTFSKAFGLAGARVGYALAQADAADELRRRLDPLPISSVSATLALAALADPPDVSAELEEVERCRARLKELGLEPEPSAANFVYVPTTDAARLYEELLAQGLVVRVFDAGIRFNVRDVEDDDLLLDAIGRALGATGEARQPARRARHVRTTAETRIACRLALDGQSRVRVQTGAGIYDHFLEQLGFHGGLDLVLEASGDLETGDHHTAEDAALTLGETLDVALGDRRGIARYGSAVVPMDDALAKAAIDLGGRPWSELRLECEPFGMAAHMFQSLAQAGRLGLHVEARGADAHHVAEAAFKAVGRALRAAVRVDTVGLPSTKGRI